MAKDSKFILALTGPAGSGKTTIGDRLAKHYDLCVNIDADYIKHMILGGFYKDEHDPGGWGFNRWDLVGDSIGLLAANFLKEGYNIIVNGYIHEVAWENVQKHIEITHKILLLPKLETNILRDSGREEVFRMGEEAVTKHHAYISDSSFLQDFIKIDSTNQTINQTFAEIIKILGKSE